MNLPLRISRPHDRIADLTVVVTTLGGSGLSNTLACIERSSVLPRYIFLCVPRQRLQLVAQFENDFTFTVPTRETGQVSQRISGFEKVHTSLALQLDDDLDFESDAIEKVYLKALELGPGFVVGGTINRGDSSTWGTKGPFDALRQVRKFFLKLLVDAPSDDKVRAGKFTKFTWFKLVEPDPSFEGHVPSDLVPGGFSMGWRTDLITYNYYPLKGKAYKEDLVHSFERSKQGIKHVVMPSVVITTEEDTSFSFSAARSHFLANRWIGLHLGCKRFSLRLHLYIILEVLYDTYRRVRLRLYRGLTYPGIFGPR